MTPDCTSSTKEGYADGSLLLATLNNSFMEKSTACVLQIQFFLHLLIYFLSSLFLPFFLYCVRMCMCVHVPCTPVREQLVVVGYLLPLCRFQGSNSVELIIRLDG